MRSVRTNVLAACASAKNKKSASCTRDKLSSGIVPYGRRVICVTAPSINEVDLIAIDTSLYNPIDTDIVINLWQRPSIRIGTRDMHEAAPLVIIVIASVL